MTPPAATVLSADVCGCDKRGRRERKGETAVRGRDFRKRAVKGHRNAGMEAWRASRGGDLNLSYLGMREQEKNIDTVQWAPGCENLQAS